MVALCGGWASAADDEDEGEPKVRVTARAIVIGADGERKEIDLREAGAGEVKKHLQLHWNSDGKESKELSIKPDGRVSGRIVIVGPDGQKKEIDLGNAGTGEVKKHLRLHWNTDGEGPKDLSIKPDGRVHGRIVVLGPDGKKREIEFGNPKKGGDDEGEDEGDDEDGDDDEDEGDDDGNDDDDDCEKCPSGVRVHTHGKMIIIGPDGQKKEIDFGGKLHEGIRIHGVLPKDYDEHIRKHFDGLGKAHGDLRIHGVLPKSLNPEARKHFDGVLRLNSGTFHALTPPNNLAKKVRELEKQVEQLRKQVEKLTAELDDE